MGENKNQPKQGREAMDVVLEDILTRVRACEQEDIGIANMVIKRDEEMAKRLAEIEKEIEANKRTLKNVALLVKIAGGLAAFITALWQIFKFIVPKGHGVS
jgi:low affinity Fe/Cu permease